MSLEDLNIPTTKEKIIVFTLNKYFTHPEIVTASIFAMGFLSAANPSLAISSLLIFNTSLCAARFFAEIISTSRVRKLLNHNIAVFNNIRNFSESLHYDEKRIKTLYQVRFADENEPDDYAKIQFVRDLNQLEKYLSEKISLISKTITTISVSLNRGIAIGLLLNIPLNAICLISNAQPEFLKSNFKILTSAILIGYAPIYIKSIKDKYKAMSTKFIMPFYKDLDLSVDCSEIVSGKLKDEYKNLVAETQNTSFSTQSSPNRLRS